MERLLQYLDDLDDLYGALGLLYERLRVLLHALIALSLVTAVACGAIFLAVLHAPIALATSTLMFVFLLYRAVTIPTIGQLRTT